MIKIRYFSFISPKFNHLHPSFKRVKSAKDRVVQTGPGLKGDDDEKTILDNLHPC
ncbi:hypothetical protein Z949_2365 [Sulfitobacter guttiformis KCTC 32187]|nr:hypothetical protein Z949_2365 [Sulfitobacter guttiformis KCTC 32187]